MEKTTYTQEEMDLLNSKVGWYTLLKNKKVPPVK